MNTPAQFRDTQPNKEEAAYLEALGQDPERYVAMPVQLELNQGIPATMVPVQHPDGQVSQALVVHFTLAIDARHLNMPQSRLLMPGEAVARLPLQGVAGSIFASWLLPRENLSSDGRQLLEAWDYMAKPEAYRLGFEARPAPGEDPAAVPSMWTGTGDPPPGLLHFHELAQYQAGFADADRLAAEAGWEAVVRRRSYRVQAVQGRSDQTQALHPSANAEVGKCPLCGRAGLEKFCTGTLEEPHPIRRMVRQASA